MNETDLDRIIAFLKKANIAYKFFTTVWHDHLTLIIEVKSNPDSYRSETLEYAFDEDQKVISIGSTAIGKEKVDFFCREDKKWKKQ